MKVQINRENYEAFYLDYLEGNLDEDATLTLFAFLADNPELQVEELGPELMDSSFVLDNDFKNNLKQDENSLAITEENIEYFLTAEKENQLTTSKINELDAFVSAHPAYNLDRKIYRLSTLSADKTVVFKDKKALKKRESIILWPFLTILAAACAVMVIWLIPNSAYNGEIRSAAGVPTIHKKVKTTNSTNEIIPKNDMQSFVAQNSSYPSNKNIQKSTSSKDVSGNLEIKKSNKFESSLTESLELNRMLQDKNPNAIAYQQTEVNETSGTTLAMTNPVKPLTNKISDIIKTQVDYKTGQDSENQRKGFYLKIGQFEFSQNKSVKPQP